ncbi:MAG TPA: NUDIX domain-containing protein, partial [Steroidobacteraceae bacterium]
LLLRDAEGRVLLQRRPATGVWAQLWSLPEAAAHANARAWFAAHIAGDYDAGEALAPVAHGFTHYRLQIQPLRWRDARALATGPLSTGQPSSSDNDDLRWIPRDTLAALGLPAPIRKLLDA